MIPSHLDRSLFNKISTDLFSPLCQHTSAAQFEWGCGWHRYQWRRFRCRHCFRAVTTMRVAAGFFLTVSTKMHFCEEKFNIRKWKTMRLAESYRLVTTVLVLNSHCGKIHNIFPTTIASPVRQRLVFNRDKHLWWVHLILFFTPIVHTHTFQS